MRLTPSLFSALLPVLTASPALAEPPQVVADIAPVHALLAQVMEGVGEPGLLLDQGADPHSVQLKPSQVRMLDGADLLVWVGPELSPWLDRIVAALDGEAIALTEHPATQLLTLGAAAQDEHDHGHDDADDDGDGDHDHAVDEPAEEDHADHADHGDPGDAHDHGGVDPHVWLSTANARAWIAVFADTLSERDPANAEAYRANAADALAGIDALEARIEARLAPHAGAEIVTFHQAFGYFDAQFGIEVAGSVRPGDASAPSAAAIDAMRALVAEHGIECAFAEPAFDPGLLDAIAGETGLRIGVLDPTGALQPVGPGHYAATLTAIGDAIADCLEKK